MKNTKYKKELPTLDLEKVLSVDEAVEMVTSQPKRKFVESVDVAVSLGIDPKKSDQNVRGSLTLPHSLGKDVKVVAFVDGEKATEAKSAGADFIGTDELLEMQGWMRKKFPEPADPHINRKPRVSAFQ